MKTIVSALFAFLSTLFRSRTILQLGIVALRHQLIVYQRTTLRPRIQPADRVLVLAFALLVRLAARTGVCSAQDRDRLAAQALSGSLGQIE